MIYICPGLALLALLIALLLWWLRNTRCQHDLSLRNVATATNAHEVRVSAYTPGAQILNASAPSNWTQTSNYLASIVWRPVGGGPIPSGNPLPGPFSIWVQNNAQPDKRVLIEWLSIGGKEVICKQILRVGCGEDPDLVPEDEPVVDTGTSASCRCLSVETDSDEDSNEFAEPDLFVVVGTPVQTGFLQVEIPYTVDVEPPTLQFTRQWDVTLVDAMGDEQPITVPISDNLTGQATFTLPQAGDYNFYLTVTDPATCVSATDRDEDDYTDTDFTSYKMAGGTTKILVQPEFCDPFTYHFTNDSTPGLSVDKWTVDGAVAQIGGDTFDYTFGSLGVSYLVCLQTNAGTACETITPTAAQNIAKFRIDYSSCPLDNFLVHFHNESTAAGCNVDWQWDFGDGVGTSTLFSPSYTHANHGTYMVHLTMTITMGGTSQSYSTTQQIVVEQWMPGFSFINNCADGKIIYKTSVANPSWTFPDGSPDTSNENNVSVCYKDPGMKIVKLYAVNQDGGHCETVRDINLGTFSHCCPRDSALQFNEFDYSGKRYRLITLLRCFGAPHPVVFGKSKLQVKNKKGKWRRKRAYEIGVELSGFLYTADFGGCKCANAHTVIGGKTRSGSARVTKRFLPALLRTRMKQGDLKSTHSVRVDAGDNGLIFTLSLWADDCGCA